MTHSHLRSDGCLKNLKSPITWTCALSLKALNTSCRTKWLYCDKTGYKIQSHAAEIHTFSDSYVNINLPTHRHRGEALEVRGLGGCEGVRDKEIWQIHTNTDDCMLTQSWGMKTHTVYELYNGWEAAWVCTEIGREALYLLPRGNFNVGGEINYKHKY